MDGDSAEIALTWLEEDGNKLIEVQDMIARLGKVKIETSITDEMIATARAYPVDKLVVFHRGKCNAWCHDDRHPSMYHGTRINAACCPVCNKSFDPIAVLMTRDGMSFINAVKELQ